MSQRRVTELALSDKPFVVEQGSGQAGQQVQNLVVEAGSECEQLGDRAVLVGPDAHPGILAVGFEAQRGRGELRQHEALVVVRGRVDEVA